jgi:polysaccharide pyruvyl transferase WcaK-like protein
MTKIFITGTTIYANNRGISAMASGTIKIIKKYIPNSKITIWHTFSESYTRSSPTTYETDVKVIKDSNAYEYLLKLPLRLFRCVLWTLLQKIGLNINILMNEKVLKEYIASDAVISLNFGDTFTDNYGKIVSVSIFCQNLLNIFSGKPVVFFPQSIGPFNTRLTKMLAKFILNRSKLIMVREKITSRYLKDIGVDEHLIHIIPDTAFLLEPANDKKVERILIDNGLTNDSEKEAIIGISVNPSIAHFSKTPEKHELYVDTISRLVNYLVKKMNAIVIFVPNVTFERGFDTKDLGNLTREKTNCKDMVISINGEYTAEELKGVIGWCDIFIGSLTHTIIAAISMNVPAIAIAYSYKTLGIMDSIGLGDYVIDFREMNYDGLISKVDEVWANREEIRKDIELKVKTQKELVLSSGKLVKDLPRVTP